MSTEPIDSATTSGPEFDSAPFIDANAEARGNYGRFNLGIVGGTGVGKSSLVNAVFGRDDAKVGKGLPVTSGVHYYHDDSLGIWDFEGFEIGSARSPSETMHEHLKTISTRPSDEQVSVVWYCVLSSADRLTRPDFDMIRELDAAGLPVILVLTKVDWAKNLVTGSYAASDDVEQFRAWLENPTDEHGDPVDLPIQGVALTASTARNGKGAGHGLGDLVARTLSLSPESEKDAFRVAQRLNLPWKREMARPVIAFAASAAAATAAVPIPIAEAAALVPIQMTMMGRVAAIYDLELKSMLTASTLAQIGAQVAGKAIARSFIKLIPGAGNAVNASVAFALTAATGEAWMRLCENVHTGKLQPGDIADAWRTYSPTIVSVIQKLVENRAAGTRNR